MAVKSRECKPKIQCWVCVTICCNIVGGGRKWTTFISKWGWVTVTVRHVWQRLGHLRITCKEEITTILFSLVPSIVTVKFQVTQLLRIYALAIITTVLSVFAFRWQKKNDKWDVCQSMWYVVPIPYNYPFTILLEAYNTSANARCANVLMSPWHIQGKQWHKMQRVRLTAVAHFIRTIFAVIGTIAYPSSRYAAPIGASKLIGLALLAR